MSLLLSLLLSLLFVFAVFAFVFLVVLAIFVTAVFAFVFVVVAVVVFLAAVFVFVDFLVHDEVAQVVELFWAEPAPALLVTNGGVLNLFFFKTDKTDREIVKADRPFVVFKTKSGTEEKETGRKRKKCKGI